MPENGRLPCGIDGLRELATDTARRTPSGQGEGQPVIRTPSGHDAQQPRKSLSDQEGAKQL